MKLRYYICLVYSGVYHTHIVKWINFSVLTVTTRNGFLMIFTSYNAFHTAAADVYLNRSSVKNLPVFAIYWEMLI